MSLSGTCYLNDPNQYICDEYSLQKQSAGLSPLAWNYRQRDFESLSIVDENDDIVKYIRGM